MRLFMNIQLSGYPIKKSHGRLEQSLFRYGLDYLTDHLLHGLNEVIDAVQLLILFLCPPDIIPIRRKRKNYSGEVT